MNTNLLEQLQMIAITHKAVGGVAGGIRRVSFGCSVERQLFTALSALSGAERRATVYASDRWHPRARVIESVSVIVDGVSFEAQCDSRNATAEEAARLEDGHVHPATRSAALETGS